MRSCHPTQQHKAMGLEHKLAELLAKQAELSLGFARRFQKSILQEAIQGRLVPQDPNDEPALVLLERIRTEKANLIKEGKLKKKDIIDSVIFRGDDNKYYEQIDGIATPIESDYDFPAYMTKRDLKSLVLPLFTIVLGKNFSMTKNLLSLRLSSHH